MIENDNQNSQQAASAAVRNAPNLAKIAQAGVQGGPAGAAAEAAVQYRKEVLVVAIAVMLLPVLVLIMLPGAIFGTLTQPSTAVNDDLEIAANVIQLRNAVQPAQTPAEQPQNVIVLEQEPPAAAYTQSSPVEEIRRQMTYEQAQNVIVDCGTCKGWTLAQVADRRAASLRWYVKGYQGENNILRAAAAIIWDSLQEKQAG